MAAARQRHKQPGRSWGLPWNGAVLAILQWWAKMLHNPRAKMLSPSKSKALLSLLAASFLLAACGTSIAETCKARGLETGTPEYRQCLAKEHAEIRQRLGGIGGGPPGGGR